MTAIVASIAAVCSASAATAIGIAASDINGDAAPELEHSGSSAGTSIKPAPWAVAISNYQSARPRRPVCMPTTGRRRWP